MTADEHERSPRAWKAVALGGVLVALIGMVFVFGFGPFGKSTVASADLEPTHVDGTGASALTTTYQSAELSLPAGEREVEVGVKLPGDGLVDVRLLSQQVEGWDHRRKLEAGAKTLSWSVPLSLKEQTACSFYVEVGGVHLREPLRLRVR